MNKINLTLLIAFAFFVTLLSGCDSSSSNAFIASNTYIEAFTQGPISRKEAAFLVFNRDIEASKINASRLEKLMKISPKVDGVFAFENNRTISFSPADAFERGKTYTIEADLSEWFETNDEDDTFSFSFSVKNGQFRARFESIEINEDNEDLYDVNLVITTADVENDRDVENAISILKGNTNITSSLNCQWAHFTDCRHELKLVGIKGEATTQTLTICANNEIFGSKSISELETVEIPSNDFDLYSVEYVADPEKYILVTFTKQLDDKRNYSGLAYIKDNVSEAVKVNGNTLRLYPDANRSGRVTISLSKNICNKSGKKLDKDILYDIEIGSGDNKPQVKLIGDGTIIPNSDKLIVPFKAICLKGVIVRVVKVLSDNMGQFLQDNDYNGYSELTHVGRIIAYKTIFLDEDGVDIMRWNNYGVDLKELIDPEPGTIYRVELSFNKSLSAWPGANEQELVKSQVASNDKVRFIEECERYNNGSYYYTDYYSYWWDDEDPDPTQDSYYSGKAVGRNVLATNIGMVAMQGTDNVCTVVVNNLVTAQPESDVVVAAYNFQNQKIKEAKTDSKGYATLTFDDTANRPFYLKATKGKECTFLKVNSGNSLSLSSFDTEGEVVRHGLKGFIYGERGVWRPGDTLHLNFMLNDIAKTLPEDHPVIMEISNPLGQVYTRQTRNRGTMGIYRFDIATDAEAPTGTWTANVSVGGSSFSKNLRVETIKPNRLKINLAMPSLIVSKKAINGTLHSEWLNGSKANNLKYTIDATFTPTETKFDNYKDYYFDNVASNYTTSEMEFTSGTLSSEGDADIEKTIVGSSNDYGMLIASFVTHVYEQSGEFSTDVISTKCSPFQYYVGIKSPQKNNTQLATGKNHTFTVASVDAYGNAAARRAVKIEVYKVSWYWWWESSNDNLANYVSNSYNKPIKKLNLTTNEKGLAEFSLKFDDDDWGTYLVIATDVVEGHEAAIKSYFDWDYMENRRSTSGNDAATQLSFNLDKEEYAPNEKIKISIPSTENSRAIVSVCNGSRILFTDSYQCTNDKTTIEINATEEMQPNAYIYVSLIQPHNNTLNDLPIRLYGVKPIKVTSPQSYLYPQISMDDEIKSESEYSITINEKNGREMAYTIAIVDEGLLDLTHFATPNPWKAFNAREALGVRFWDMYSHVVGAYGAKLEQIFSIGGDDALNNSPKAIVNRFTPIVKVEGPFVLAKGKKQTHKFKMPNYNGRVRVMVVAGDGRAYGNVDKSVIVRKPVMLLGTLPRVIGVGETMDIPATIFATKDGVGNISTKIECSDNMEIVGSSTKTITLNKQGDSTIRFRIKVKDKAGVGFVRLTASAGSDKATYETNINIRSISEKQVEVTSVSIEPGKEWNSTITMPGIEGTNSLDIELSSIQPINLASRLRYLMGYPHGCIEQTTSKIFPQLYLADFTELSDAQKNEIESNITAGINRLRSFQLSNGLMSYWPKSSYSSDWGSVYAAHFLIEAANKGYFISGNLKSNLLTAIKNVARNYYSTNKSNGEDVTQCYRLYVLALAQQAEMGAMNRMKENVAKLPLSAKNLLATAYAISGHVDIAKNIIAQTTKVNDNNSWGYTYGSELRNSAISFIAATAINDTEHLPKNVEYISKELSSDKWLSTQETAFTLFSLAQYYSKNPSNSEMKYEVEVNGDNIGKAKTEKRIVTLNAFENGKKSAKVNVENEGKGIIYLRAIAEGELAQGTIEPASNSIDISVRYFDESGHDISVSNLQQGTNFKAQIVIKNKTNYDVNNLVLTQYLPSGWEALCTPYVNQSNEPNQLSYRDVRDDRIFCYVDLLRASKSVEITLDLCATYSGEFYLPAVVCEAMYDNTIRANNASQFVTVE